MYFTFEEMSLGHLQAPVIEPFCSGDYHAPRHVFANNVTYMTTRQFLSRYPDQRDDGFVHIETDIPIFAQFIGAASPENAWQAFFDDIDFYHIDDQSVLEFLIAKPELINEPHDMPYFEVIGHLARMLMAQFNIIRDVNNNVDYVPAHLTDENTAQDDFYYHAYALLNDGFHPISYDGSTLKFEQVSAIEKRTAPSKNAFLPRDGDGYGSLGY